MNIDCRTETNTSSSSSTLPCAAFWKVGGTLRRNEGRINNLWIFFLVHKEYRTHEVLTHAARILDKHLCRHHQLKHKNLPLKELVWQSLEFTPWTYMPIKIISTYQSLEAVQHESFQEVFFSLK